MTRGALRAVRVIRPRKTHVFISYAREDASEFATRLKSDLPKQGLRCWSDGEMKPGVPFGSVIKTAIDKSFAMLALISPCALTSYWVKAEWCYALSTKSVTIIPAIVPGFDEVQFPFELFPLTRCYLRDGKGYPRSLEEISALMKFAKEVPPIW